MSSRRLLDMHIHSDNSPDGCHSVTVLCEKALESGMRAIALTDHCECNLYRAEGYDQAVRQSYFESIKAKSVFWGQLLILSGVELGQPLQDLDAAADALSAGNFDFVLCSLHNVPGTQDFYYLDYALPEYEPYSLLDRYFAEMLEMAKTVDFDSLSHLTYPLRYMVGEKGLEIDMSRYEKIIDEIFTTLIKREKALEINLSGLRGKLNDTMPYKALIKRFHDLGGKYITIGSDAHKAEHIGMNVNEGMALAQECGFDAVTLFEKRVPIKLPI